MIIQNNEPDYIKIEEDLGFQMMTIEEKLTLESNEGNNPFELHRADFNTMMLLSDGEMTHKVDFMEYEMVKGDCLFMSKDQIHKFDQSSTYRGHIIMFTEEFMLRHFSLSASSKISSLFNNHLSPSLYQNFGDRHILILAIKRELSLDLGEIKADVLACILTAFLLKAQAHKSQNFKTYDADYQSFMKFQSLVTSNYMHTRKSREYALILNTTYKQLNMLCKTFTDKTAKEYIDDYVVLQAKRLMTMTKHTIKQVAYECGFSEPTNFLKFFKKIAGISPSQFREVDA